MSLMDDNRSFLVDLLGNLPLFADLPPQALLELASLFSERVFQKNELIFEEESRGDSMMVIISGEARVSQRADKANEETLGIMKKGDFIGEMALLEELPRSATVVAHTDTFLLEITRERFMRFLETDPDSGVRILLQLARSLSARLREADTKIKTFVNLTQWI